MKPFCIELPIHTVSEANQREHWGKKAKRAQWQRGGVKVSLIAHFRAPPKPPLVVTLTRLAPRKLDTDNNVSGFKATRDGVADWLGIDDGADCITWLYAQEKVSKRYAIRIELMTPAQAAVNARIKSDMRDASRRIYAAILAGSTLTGVDATGITVFEKRIWNLSGTTNLTMSHNNVNSTGASIVLTPGQRDD